jgi:hypothetical protein
MPESPITVIGLTSTVVLASEESVNACGQQALYLFRSACSVAFRPAIPPVTRLVNPVLDGAYGTGTRA